MIQRQLKATLATWMLILISISTSAANERNDMVFEHSVLTGDWAGWRTSAAENGLEFEFVYTGEVFHNFAGGISRGTEYLDNFDLILAVDAEALFAWPGASFLLNGLGNHGGSPSTHVGDVQAVSNIDAADTWKLYQAWYQQNFLNDRLSFLLGLHDLNSEFDVIETASLFIHSSHGMGAELAQSGQNGPSIFPTTSLAARVRGLPLEYLYIQSAVYDGVPGDPNDPKGTQIQFDDGDGLLVVGEIGFFPNKLNNRLYDAKLAVGGWAYTAKQEELIIVNTTDVPVPYGGHAGVYGFIESQLSSERDAPEQGLFGFVRFGYANANFNQFKYYLGTGFTYAGLIPSRDEDQIGIAMASAWNGKPFAAANDIENVILEIAEVDIEFTYHLQLLPWLALQPDFQWVINPGTDTLLKDVFVTVLRWEVGL